MSKKLIYVCQNCGANSIKWSGRCDQCQEWNTFVEEAEEVKPNKHASLQLFKPSSDFAPLSEKLSQKMERMHTGIAELDRVLGGGIVPGSYTLIGGSPGIGKSTLVLQMSLGMSQLGKVLYVCAEESTHQTSLRARRLGIASDDIFLYNENSLDLILEKTKKVKPGFLIIDSIQSVHTSELSSAPGTVSQVRESASLLMHFAKSTNTPVLIIGHVTKDGNLAGPRVLEHIVDTVLSFEGHAQFRILKSIKNRFGAVNEIGVFKMCEDGLQEVNNPSEFFLEEHKEDKIGSAVFSAIEGQRPLLCEIQALAISSFLPMPRRTSIGIEVSRLHLILAVLEKYFKIHFSKYDIFLNLVGGLKLTEPATDMAVAVALLSSYHKKPIQTQACFFGEIGLSGEIRSVPRGEERIKESIKLGFKEIYIPDGNVKQLNSSLKKGKIDIHSCKTIFDLDKIFK